MSNKIVLSDLNLVYPPQSSLPKEQGSFILLRLSQFPAKDDTPERNIIDGEYTNCCYTSAFGKQTSVKSPDGRVMRFTVSVWNRNKDGNITNPSSGKQLTFWIEDGQDDVLKEYIANSMFYMYGDRNNPDAEPMWPDEYEKHIHKLTAQAMLSSKTPDANMHPELGGN